MKTFTFLVLITFFLFSCENKAVNISNSEKPARDIQLLEPSEGIKPIVSRGNLTEEKKTPTEEEVYGFALTNDDLLKYVNEDIFFGIHSDPNYYINNDDYAIEYKHLPEDPGSGIMQDTDLIIARNDYMDIEFANNVLINVTIKKKTGLHFFGRFIGEDIHDVINILGDNYWHQDRAYIYHGLNRTEKKHHSLQIITVTSKSNKIYQLNFGINGILSNGLLPKTSDYQTSEEQNGK
ncbi:hypothetical protein [Breznakiella homolactica]|uniref:Lipoprotein n=1 Tax=Breznakiella homolactica TaxID=2798577 RepID=A0A7T7XKF2_9SPIR|nr:hypothetical protein [Breznakiella homolactica]QQO07837.1 hypothetical protein JFL75_12905 [Breznakiella homolactica]